MNENSFSPDSFKQVLGRLNPSFAGIQANAPKDLIYFLLETLHQEMNKIKNINLNYYNNMIQQEIIQMSEELSFKSFLEGYRKQFRSKISDLFYGTSENQYTCQGGCNRTRYIFQVYCILEFPLEQVNRYFYNKGKRGQSPSIFSNNKNPDVNLEECFEYYEKENIMTGDNQIYCSKCSRLCNAIHLTKLLTAPRCLIININRGKNFNYQCNFDFPEILNLSKYLTYKKVNTDFELYAVINYLNGGFFAFIKNESNNKWYLYNDSNITECSRMYQYKEGMTYILFYQSQNT